MQKELINFNLIHSSIFILTPFALILVLAIQWHSSGFRTTGWLCSANQNSTLRKIRNKAEYVNNGDKWIIYSPLWLQHTISMLIPTDHRRIYVKCIMAANSYNPGDPQSSLATHGYTLKRGRIVSVGTGKTITSSMNLVSIYLCNYLYF